MAGNNGWSREDRLEAKAAAREEIAEQRAHCVSWTKTQLSLQWYKVVLLVVASGASGGASAELLRWVRTGVGLAAAADTAVAWWHAILALVA